MKSNIHQMLLKSEEVRLKIALLCDDVAWNDSTNQTTTTSITYNRNINVLGKLATIKDITCYTNQNIQTPLL